MQRDKIKTIKTPHTILDSRICCIAPGPNLIYMGTVSGDLKVAFSSTGEILRERSWNQANTPIEGVMFDYEGKVVYGTEFNLVILDKELKKKLKEVRSVQPLRKEKINLFYENLINLKN